MGSSTELLATKPSDPFEEQFSQILVVPESSGRDAEGDEVSSYVGVTNDTAAADKNADRG